MSPTLGAALCPGQALDLLQASLVEGQGAFQHMAIACGPSGERLCPVNDGGPAVAIFASLMALLGGRGEGGAPPTRALKPSS